MNEKQFKTLVQARLIDTGEVAEMLGLETESGVRSRVRAGQISPPVIVKHRGWAFFDRQQIEKDESARLKKAAAESLARVGAA